jgi:hypothetical protein
MILDGQIDHDDMSVSPESAGDACLREEPYL